MSDVSASRGGARAEGPEQTTDLRELRDLIKSIKFCMLTTMDESGQIHSRPMAINHPEEFNGELYMFTYGGSHKCFEIGKEHHVNLSIADPTTQKYASLSGTADVIRDRQLMEKKWTPSLAAWFPKGLDEPDIALVRVEANAGEYWDAPNSILSHSYSLIKGKLTEVVGSGEPKQVRIQ